mmetsp:Transcript_3536/g.12423  ORF Transcript_3536/g.12423 Transcript_3536/m.12423 type:complete len:127 (-) Transcript_3536:407-787(-)
MPEKRRRQSKKGGCKRRRGTGKCNQRGDEREGVVEQIQLQDKALVEAFAASIEDALAEARLPQRSEEEEEEEEEEERWGMARQWLYLQQLLTLQSMSHSSSSCVFFPSPSSLLACPRSHWKSDSCL